MSRRAFQAGRCVSFTALLLCGVTAAAQAQMWKLPQVVILKHETALDVARRGAAGEKMVGALNDLTTSMDGHEVGFMAGEGTAARRCVLGAAGAPTVSATLMSHVGITGMRKVPGGIQFRIGYRTRPQLLFRGSAPEPCDAEFRKRAEDQLTQLLHRLQTEPVMVTAAQLLEHMPLGGDAPTGSITLRKTLRFFDTQAEAVFQVPLARLM